MIWFNEFNDVILLLWSYLVIYNLALLVVFMTLFQLTNNRVNTLYALSDLGSTGTFTKLLVISLFSMAGVPPFWGFFSKVFIFLLLLNSNFFIFFSFFFILLLTGLYFYIQNIRFLNPTSAAQSVSTVELNVRRVPSFYYLTYTSSYFLIVGFFFTEDLFLLLTWILV